MITKHTIIFIVGPTSSGKTSVAVELARRLNGEIVSCDSMQVYKDMDVITQSPGEDVKKGVPHHLIKCVPPSEEYHAVKYAAEAEKAVADIIKRDKVPVICGGTGLYMKALLDGIFLEPSGDETLREKLKKEAVEKGGEYLHEKLRKVDPETAKKLHPNDVNRLVRALEVYEITGRTIHNKKKEAKGIGLLYDVKIFGLAIDRGTLYDRINRTVEGMFEQGIVEEVKRLKKKKLSKTAAKALGIKEVSLYLEGAMGLEAAKEEIKIRTRQYAKRQLTWFRADERVEWINADRSAEEVAGDILERLRDN